MRAQNFCGGLLKKRRCAASSDANEPGAKDVNKTEDVNKTRDPEDIRRITGREAMPSQAWATAPTASSTMKKRFLMSALVLISLASASPAVLAQSASTNALSATTNSLVGTSNGQLGTGAGATSTQQSTQTSTSNQTSDTICVQELAATFCNTPTAPNTNGYGTIGNGSGASTSGSSGSGSGTGSASAGSGASGAGANNTSSIPACGGFPSANELCN
jgi:hypothetical protein